ncbi:hypothetical protein P691DRAFT_789464 [Macrolepiota fuliginosa MF-IS2]|uniref:Nephrocystin 3-like N-terminal domain-containing protein n=1 Tax=Macrolepiota fuliginosa MF-IS2 TaxID=1400762 RepID=A0A9P5X397_9AGAR|nr:hypothetical protein P691DRAFT_789464 [Macrolepiota fuliginosa MF-IS2]
MAELRIPYTQLHWDWATTRILVTSILGVRNYEQGIQDCSCAEIQDLSLVVLRFGWWDRVVYSPQLFLSSTRALGWKHRWQFKACNVTWLAFGRLVAAQDLSLTTSTPPYSLPSSLIQSISNAMADPSKPRSRRAAFKRFFSRLSPNIVSRPTSPANTVPAASSPTKSTPATPIISAPQSDHDTRPPINVTGPQYDHNDAKHPMDTPGDSTASKRVMSGLGSPSDTMAHSEPPKNTNLVPSLNISPFSDDEIHAHSIAAIAQSGRRPASMYSFDVPAPQNNDITLSTDAVLAPNETIPPTPSIAVIPPDNLTRPVPITATSSAATTVGHSAPSRRNSPAIASPHPQVAPQPTNALEASVTTPGAFAGASGWIVENFHVYAQETISHNSSEMKPLLKKIIRGAQYDSSARDPPPECHPGTRVKMLERMCTWFFHMDPQKAFLWIYGPAGVGKSAVVQTFAEALAAANRLGATLFFSRPNDRNDPKRVLITIAYQLAVRIPSYRAFVIEQISLDPELLEKGMKEQFKVFIVAPFVHRRIGQGREALGILLDGLDECEGQDPQRDIIRLISGFVRDYPDVPLIWVISSRPEPNISLTFREPAVMVNHWQEYIPVDSTEACQDVERFLTTRFDAIRARFPYVSPHWPSEMQRLKLTHTSSGLFVFAEAATRFIGDEDYADPESRLDVVLSIIDHTKVTESGDQPFATLDALYTHILLSIPQRSWPTAKLVLGHILCQKHLPYSIDMRNLKAFSKTFPADLRRLGICERAGPADCCGWDMEGWSWLGEEVLLRRDAREACGAGEGGLPRGGESSRGCSDWEEFLDLPLDKNLGLLFWLGKTRFPRVYELKGAPTSIEEGTRQASEGAASLARGVKSVEEPAPENDAIADATARLDRWYSGMHLRDTRLGTPLQRLPRLLNEKITAFADVYNWNMGILASSALDPTCPFEGKAFHGSLCITSSSLVSKSLLSRLLVLSAVIPETNPLQHPSNPSAAFFFNRIEQVSPQEQHTPTRDTPSSRQWVAPPATTGYRPSIVGVYLPESTQTLNERVRCPHIIEVDPYHPRPFGTPVPTIFPWTWGPCVSFRAPTTITRERVMLSARQIRLRDKKRHSAGVESTG